jgi:hypothetical protein
MLPFLLGLDQGKPAANLGGLLPLGLIALERQGQAEGNTEFSDQLLRQVAAAPDLWEN